MRVNLEHDIIRDNRLMELVQDDSFAKKLYAAMCNIRWLKDGQEWACSWRYSGEIVANARNKGEDYCHFYCSGNEGIVDPVIETELKRIGWTWEIFE